MRLVILVVIALTGIASAERKVAERYFRAGEKAYQAQNFKAAADSFELAYKELPLPEIAFSAAQAYRRQYRVEPRPEYVRRAVELYRLYLDKVHAGGRVGDAADSLGEMQHEYDKLAAAGKLGVAATAALTRLGVSVVFGDAHETGGVHEIEDTGSAPAIQVATKIDGTSVEPPDSLVAVAPGEHLIRVEAPGFLPGEKKVTAVVGSSDIVEIDLQPRPAHVKIETEHGSRISVDGRAAAGELAVPAGRHLITVTHLGREPVGREVVVARGQELALEVPLVTTRRRRAVPWVAGAAGALVVLAGVNALAAVHFDRQASRELRGLQQTGDQLQPALDAYQSTRDNRDHFVDVTWGAAAAALGVGLVALWLYQFDTPSAEGIKVTPMAGSAGGGAAVSGRF